MLEPILGVPISSTGMQYLTMGWALKAGALRRSCFMAVLVHSNTAVIVLH